MATTELPVSVRNEWINRLRKEALRMRRPEVSKCVHIGILIATYADADGTRCYPGQDTLAVIAGSTEETVSRCIKVLMAVGLLKRNRRPNKSSEYLLAPPLGSKTLPWEEHLHLYTDTRQAKRKQRLKEQEIAASLAAPAEDRTPLQNGDHTAPDTVPDGGPDTVPAGGSEKSGHRSGTGADTVLDRVPEPVAERVDHYTPTFGRDPATDQVMADDSPQPQVGGRASGEEFDRSQQQEAAASAELFGRCEQCHVPLVRPGRSRCPLHTADQGGRKQQTARQRPIQAPLLMPVPNAPAAPQQAADAPQTPVSKIRTPWAPERTCGCGRTHRTGESNCPLCLELAREEAARLAAAHPKASTA
ncbi:hypothetical protein [Streptomyces mirabilis]|uniref:hypothetical protein n=1 Tax=Streptomyces mirabilis TaxID=68239 RepID=UPI0036DEE508